MNQMSGCTKSNLNGQQMWKEPDFSDSKPVGKVHWTQPRSVRAVAVGVGALVILGSTVVAGVYGAAIAVGAVAVGVVYFYIHRRADYVPPAASGLPEAGTDPEVIKLGYFQDDVKINQIYEQLKQDIPNCQLQDFKLFLNETEVDIESFNNAAAKIENDLAGVVVQVTGWLEAKGRENNKVESGFPAEPVSQQSSASQEDIERIHKAIDDARKEFAQGIQQTCIIDAIAAYKATKNEVFDKVPTVVGKYFSTHGGGVQFDLATHMLEHGQLDLSGGSEVVFDDNQQQIEKEKTAKFESARAKGRNQQNTQKDDEFRMEEHRCYIAVSGISKNLDDNEIRRMKRYVDQKFTDGCLVLNQANGNGGGTGHYSYYHPELGFITGGQEALRAGNSAYDFQQFISLGYNQTKNGVAYFYNVAELCK